MHWQVWRLRPVLDLRILGRRTAHMTAVVSAVTCLVQSTHASQTAPLGRSTSWPLSRACFRTQRQNQHNNNLTTVSCFPQHTSQFSRTTFAIVEIIGATFKMSSRRTLILSHEKVSISQAVKYKEISVRAIFAGDLYGTTQPSRGRLRDVPCHL